MSPNPKIRNRASSVPRILVIALAAMMLPFTFTPGAAEEAAHTVSHHELVRPDGAKIVYSVFKPAGADATATVPLVFHSHGWGGSHTSNIGGIVEDLLDAGYGVLSFTARGHGGSTGLAAIHNKDFEVHDTSALIDWAHDNLVWVTKDTGSGMAKDIRIGAVGGSYGGGFQTTSASYDHRWDALVPQMTWNDLTYSLAPNDVLKSVWVTALYGVGEAQIDMIPEIREWYWTIQATHTIPESAITHLTASSPNPEDITTPTLLVQGQPDHLFNWNEAVANYEGIASAGTEVALVGYNGGHVLPGVQPLGFMGPSRSNSPCGTYSDLAISWFAKHLDGDANAVVPTGVSYATEQNTCVSTAGPEDNTRVDVDIGVAAFPSGSGSVLIPLDVEPGTLAGIPTVSASLIGSPGDHVHFFSLVVRDGATGRTHIVDDQSTPFRYSSLIGGADMELDMVGVATTLDADDQLFLRVDAQNEWFATNSARMPGTSVALDLTVSLPFADA